MKPFMTIIFSTVLIISSTISLAQRKVDHNNQYWLGYMTSTMIAEKYSIWTDFHVIPEGFGVARTGLTRHFGNSAVTGGYAYLWLPPGNGNTRLERHEHRPWAQLQFNLPVDNKLTLIQRIRYDARFRENVLNGEVQEGYTFNHRVRFLVSLKRTLKNKEGKMTPYVALSNEVLLNFGKEVTTNTFDQNRLSVSFGVQSKKTQYQLGLMNRFVQTGPSKFTANHTLVLWITQKFDLQKVISRKLHHESVSE